MQADTTLVFAPDHPAFAGHFPGRPIVPGVLLLDAAIHSLTQALQRADKEHDETGPSQKICQILQINAVKFLSPVGPGEILTITCRNAPSGSTRFEITGPGRKVAEGTLAWSARP